MSERTNELISIISDALGSRSWVNEFIDLRDEIQCIETERDEWKETWNQERARGDLADNEVERVAKERDAWRAAATAIIDCITKRLGKCAVCFTLNPPQYKTCGNISFYNGKCPTVADILTHLGAPEGKS